VNDDRGPVTLLDGGTGQELLRRAAGAPTPLWSARVMLDEPELVTEVHRAYLDAGADVITVNAYSATPERLAPYGLEDEYERLQRLSVDLARSAVAERPGARVAGCLSPYRWTYRPELAPAFDELWPAYAATAALQVDGVDLILCETMGSIDEARAAVVGAGTTGLPVWVSWTLADDAWARLRSGERLADAVAAAERWSSAGDADLRAVLVNCSRPETVTNAIAALTGTTLATGAYANGFGHIAADYDTGSVTTELGRSEMSPIAYAEVATSWVASGARIVGGCCEIGPEHIAELSSRLGRPGDVTAGVS
jgi:S-methylmethionine-dependent homocysteine/selenocysteine methylase